MSLPRRPAPRLLLVVDSLVGGGAEQHVVDVARGLADRGWDVTVACSCLAAAGQDGARAEAVLAGHVTVHPLLPSLVKRRASVRFAARLRSLVAREGYDVVHAHIHASEVAAALALARTGVPLVLTEHTEGPWRGPVARLTARLALHRADAVIAVSTAVERRLVQEYAVPPDRVRLLLPVGRGVPPRRGARRPPDLPEAPLVGFVGRLQPEKGVDVLVRAFATLLDEHPSAHLVVVGNGPERAALEELSGRLGIAPSVTYLGSRPDAVALLPWFDVVAVPSRTDGAPLVAHEAMLAGVPVVGSAVGGIVDRLWGGQAGVLVPPGDPQALAVALAGLLADPEARRRQAAAGREAAQALSFDGMLDGIEAVYESVARSPRGRAFA